MAKSYVGEELHGYTLLEPFRIANGGNCEWTFAVRGGTEYFLKRFFSPKYPVSRDGKPPAGQAAARVEKCKRFEAEQRHLMVEGAKAAGPGGRLVVPTDFFRIDSVYYKAAEKVDALPLTVSDIARLPLAQKQTIMNSIVSALRALHSVRIVHGDLSPANILISKRGDGYIANVIDFDSSFFDGAPPPPEDTMGNPPFYSPELLTYLQRDDGDGKALTTRSDIFALGIVFWAYIFGELPVIKEPFHYAAEAIRAGHPLAMPPATPLKSVADRGARALIQSMLNVDPAERPSMLTIQTTIRKGFVGAPEPAPTREPPPPGAKEPYAGRSRVSSRIPRKEHEPAPVDEPSSAPVVTPTPDRSRVVHRSKRGE